LGICGPLVGGALLAQMLASALDVEFSFTEREPLEVVATLLLLGSAAARYFAERGLPLEVVKRVPFELWVPAECPLCASGAPLENASVA
jgi:hypothetical protein